MLDASPRVVAAAGSGLIDLHAPRVVEHADGTTTRADARSCGKANHASLTWICDVEQLYTDAALMLDASPRVVAAAGSGLIDLHVPLASLTMQMAQQDWPCGSAILGICWASGGIRWYDRWYSLALSASSRVHAPALHTASKLDRVNSNSAFRRRQSPSLAVYVARRRHARAHRGCHFVRSLLHD